MKRYRVAAIYWPDLEKSPHPLLLQELSEMLLRFSPEIAIRSKDSAVFLEIGKCRSLYSEQRFLRHLPHWIQALPLWKAHALREPPKIAIAEDATRALIAAKYGAPLSPESPLEVLNEVANPFGPAPPAVESLIQTLNRLGIQKLEGFERLPVSELASRFGPLSLHLRHQLAHPNSLPWPTWKPRPQIKTTLELLDSEACHQLEPTLFQIKRALDILWVHLRSRALACSALQLELKQERGSHIKNRCRTYPFRFMLPQVRASATLKLIQERLEREWLQHPLEGCVVEITLEVLETTHAELLTESFLKSSARSEDWNAAVAHLAESLGHDRVFQAQLVPERFPERSWKRIVPKNKLHAGSHSSDEPGVLNLAPRPTRLLQAPKKIEVTREKVFLKSRQQTKVYTIVEWSRMERISGHWLDDPEFKAKERNYFQVAIQEGPPLWIFEDRKHEFYLQGWFE